MTDVKAKEAAPAAKRDRSPQFPYIGLAKAVERIEKIFEKAKRHEVRVADIAGDWKLSPKSSSTDRNVAALLSYGLVEESGSGDARKIKVSDAGWRILDDGRPGVREKLLAEAALKPPIVAEYARLWGDGRPDDTHSLSQLKFEGGFTEEGAAQFLRVFDETIRFTKGSDSAKAPDTGAEKEPVTIRAKVGDFVQWTSNGSDQFKSPARVVGVSDDGAWLWVEGSQTGIPMAEAQIVQNAAGAGASATPPAPPAELMAALAAKAAVPPGTREEKFALKEGDVVITFPEGMSPDSVEDLDDYIQVFLKKARREAGMPKKTTGEAPH